MLMTFTQLGITRISCKDHGDRTDYTSEIQELHYKINAEIFKYSKTVCTPVEANTVISNFIEYGVALTRVASDDNVTSNYLKDCLRKFIKTLKQYTTNFRLEQQDLQIIQTRINHYVNRYLKDKKSNALTSTSVLQHLEYSKENYNNLLLPFKDVVKDNVNLKTFLSCHKEMIDYLHKCYAINL